MSDLLGAKRVRESPSQQKLGWATKNKSNMKNNFPISNKYRSNPNNFDNREKFLILHYTAVDFQSSLDILTNKLSVHYLVSNQPVEGCYIFQLVDDNKRAWHAGVSSWEDRNNLNDSSIGIEIVNLDGNQNPYPQEQIEAVIFLCRQIISKYNIAPNYVLGHSDIAPLRKEDPGTLFPWATLYQNGIGAMPEAADVTYFENTNTLPSALQLQQNLKNYGYKIDLTSIFDQQTATVLDSFRRHFCPNLIGQEIDKTSYATLLALLKKYKPTIGDLSEQCQ